MALVGAGAPSPLLGCVVVVGLLGEFICLDVPDQTGALSEYLFTLPNYFWLLTNLVNDLIAHSRSFTLHHTSHWGRLPSSHGHS